MQDTSKQEGTQKVRRMMTRTLGDPSERKDARAATSIQQGLPDEKEGTVDSELHRIVKHSLNIAASSDLSKPGKPAIIVIPYHGVEYKVKVKEQIEFGPRVSLMTELISPSEISLSDNYDTRRDSNKVIGAVLHEINDDPKVQKQFLLRPIRLKE